MKLTVAVFLLLAAVGCSSPRGTVVGQEYLARRAQAATSSKQCMDAVKSGNPVYERLSNLFIYDLNDDRQLTKMTNRSYVSEQNIADLVRFREMIQPCYDRSLTDYGSADSRYAEYMLNVRAGSDDNLLALLNRRITIGERNVYLLETLQSNRIIFTEIDRQVLAELNRERGLSSASVPEASVVEEEGDPYPTVIVPRRPELEPSVEELRRKPVADSHKRAERCRFEGAAIRCD